MSFDTIFDITDVTLWSSPPWVTARHVGTIIGPSASALVFAAVGHIGLVVCLQLESWPLFTQFTIGLG